MVIWIIIHITIRFFSRRLAIFVEGARRKRFGKIFEGSLAQNIEESYIEREMKECFANRRQAGQRLAEKVLKYASREDVIVLALPRGGVPIGYEIALKLHAPLDVWVVRKLGVPGYEELAFGAIASGGLRVLNAKMVEDLCLSESAINEVAEIEQKELERRERLYRGDKRPLDIQGKIVLLADDGLATGSTMQVAAAALRQQEPSKIVVAVPVAPRGAEMMFRDEVAEFVSVISSELFFAVGEFYEDFAQTSDQEVHELLMQSDRLYGAGEGNRSVVLRP